jgi:hypothetical protein
MPFAADHAESGFAPDRVCYGPTSDHLAHYEGKVRMNHFVSWRQLYVARLLSICHCRLQFPFPLVSRAKRARQKDDKARKQNQTNHNVTDAKASKVIITATDEQGNKHNCNEH